MKLFKNSFKNFFFSMCAILQTKIGEDRGEWMKKAVAEGQGEKLKFYFF